MIDGNKKRNGWLNFELQSLHVIERRSNFMKVRQTYHFRFDFYYEVH